MSDFNLDSFLKARQSEGVDQGEGDFTISHSKAATKMAQFSLPREESWVLKLVQAATLWNCRSLRLRQTRKDSLFTFKFDSLSELPRTEELVEALIRADFESEKAVDHLGGALRIMVERGHLSFLLLSDSGEQEESQAIYAGVYFSEMDEQGRKSYRNEWEPGLTLAVHHISHTETNRLLLNFIPIRRFGLPILLELEQFAYTCPMSLAVDGRRFHGPLRSGALGWSYRKKPLLMGSIPPDKDGGVLDLNREFAEVSLTLSTSIEEALDQVTPGEPAQAFFLLAWEVANSKGDSSGARRRSHVNWVKNGIIIQRELIDIATQYLVLEVWADAKGLKTDLTGFQLVESPELTRRKALVFGKLSTQLFNEMVEGRDILGHSKMGEDSLSLKDVVNNPDKTLAIPASDALTTFKGLVKTEVPKGLTNIDFEDLGFSSLTPVTQAFKNAISEAFVVFKEASQDRSRWGDAESLRNVYAAELAKFIEGIRGI